MTAPKSRKLEPCWCSQYTGKQPEEFQRCRWVGDGPIEVLYYWVECAGTPPCETGECHKDPDAAIDAWNKRAKR